MSSKNNGQDKPAAVHEGEPGPQSKTSVLARLRDVRVWIWPAALALAFWLEREWSPRYAIWVSRAGAPFSWCVAMSIHQLVLPGLLMLASAVGLARAWRGRSAINGPYIIACILVLAVSAGVCWMRTTHRLYFTDQRATVVTYGVYFRTIEREDAKELRWQKVRSGRGIVRWHPVLVRRDGSEVSVQGAGMDEWAEAIKTRWGLPEKSWKDQR